MSARTALVNTAQGLVKSYGERLRKCGTQQVSRELGVGLSAELRQALEPLLREVESLNERIKEYDRRIDEMAKEAYPEVALLKQVKGVGNLIALTFVSETRIPGMAPLAQKKRFILRFGGFATEILTSVPATPERADITGCSLSRSCAELCIVVLSVFPRSRDRAHRAFHFP